MQLPQTCTFALATYINRGRKHSLMALSLAFSVMSSAALAAEPCAANFNAFLLKFEATPAFQAENTRFPLAASRVDGNAEPEPKTGKYRINSASDPKYSPIVYPSKEKQAAIPLGKVVRSKQKRIFVQFSQPDTDHSFAYVFEKTASCWRLVRFEDYSL
jgi:hypothetical protein